jgi:hypothetical protein
MLAYPAIMYQCIERMDRMNDKHIDETVLASTVRQYAKPLESAEKERLLSAFNTENLLHSNVVSDIDKRKEGRFLLFQEAILLLLRLCEAALYQEVTDAKLRSRIAGLWDVRDRLMSASFAEHDPGYTELTDDIMEQFGSLLAMLRNNILAMQRIGKKLESMTAEASKSPEDFPQYRQSMFEQTNHLFERHIKPTLTFLDPSVHLTDSGKSRTNLFKTIEEIRAQYLVNDKHTVADQILRYSISFANIFQPVQKVERQVDHFLRKTRTGMLQYNAMESSFQKLKRCYDATQTSNLRHRFMEQQDFTGLSGFVPGLKQHIRPQAYQFGDSISYYENIFSEIELRLSQLTTSQTSIFTGESSKDNQAGRQLERAELLYQWLEDQPFRPTEDMIATLHHRLYDWLEGYHFPDLLTVIIRLNHKTDWSYELITTNRFAYITINNDAFLYRRRKLVTISPKPREAANHE